MKTRMNRKLSMGMAAAFVMAMTSTLSAQAVQGKGGISGPSASAPTHEVSTSSQPVRADLSDPGALSMATSVTGWCGTDTSVIDNAFRVRIHLQLLALLLASGTGMFPGDIAMKAGAFRRWYQATIDVLPG